MSGLYSSVYGVFFHFRMILKTHRCCLQSVAWLFAFSVVLSSVAPILARPATEVEKAALGARIVEFNDAMRSASYGKVVAIGLAPRLLIMLAEKAGEKPDVFLDKMAAFTAQVMGTVQIESYMMDFAAAEYKELANGSPYGLIPTVTTVVASGLGKVTSTEDTLALMDGDKWFLVRVSEPAQVALLRMAYPEFADVTFRDASMEIEKK